jgi:hypothetical protein
MSEKNNEAISLTTLVGFNSATIGADFSSQAHIFLSPNRFGQTNPNYDQRAYDSIKTGLKPGFNFLSYIKPLGQTVLHEVRASCNSLSLLISRSF